MTEYLNEKEKLVLLFLGQQYRKHYDILLEVPAHDFIVVDGHPVDMLQNLLQALKLRGYINTERFHVEFNLENINFVLLTEKALNLFNSELFDEWIKEEKKQKK